MVGLKVSRSPQLGASHGATASSSRGPFVGTRLGSASRGEGRGFGPGGSLLVLEAESLEAVREIVRNDPFWTGDVVRIKFSFTTQ